ncbi:MAG: alcohol dehydrogenase catalytic domain-containing protein [Steroidobacteraceae bacterium]
MKAFELRRFNEPLIETSRPIPVAGPGEVCVRVEACGVCGSDLFLQKGGFGKPLPIVPGHEAAGRIHSLGSAVSGWQVGDQVALYYISAPPDDPWAKAGHPNRSPNLRRMGVDVDGAFAEFVVRPVETLIRPPRPIPPPVLAVLTDAVATPLHALKRIAAIQSGESVAILGIGGIGSAAIGIARALGARVIAVARSEARRALARALGADEVVSSGDPSLAERLREITAGIGPQVVLQCTGSSEQDALAVRIAAPGARVVLVGVSTSSFSLKATDLIWRELSVMGSRGFLPADIRDAIELYSSGALDVSRLVQQVRPLGQVNAALEDLRHARVLRTVLTPQGP